MTDKKAPPRAIAAPAQPPADSCKGKVPPLNIPTQLPLIDHRVNGVVVAQRPRDGYINATAMCNKAGKKFADYYRLNTTAEFLKELGADMGIPISELIQVHKGGGNPKAQGTWVHPDVAINLGQWLSPRFAVLVSRWVREWSQGNVSGFMPVHVRRYIKNRSKIPPGYFSMLNEIYLELLAPMEDAGYVMPDKMMPDISTGRMFSAFLRKKGITPEEFPTYTHEFADESRPPVHARLYPIKHLPEFREYFNQVWLPQRATIYFREKDEKALAYIPLIQALPPPKV